VSSDLYYIHILEVEPRAFTMRVTSVHPDVDDLPENPTFAFQILSEAWEEIYPPDFSTWQGWGSWPRPGKSLPFLEDNAAPFDPTDPWRYVLPVPRSEPFVRIQTPKFIAAFDLLEKREVSDDSLDEETRPEGVYRVEVTDERWVTPLRAGMGWGTTAYDMGPVRTRDEVWASFSEEATRIPSLAVEASDSGEPGSLVLTVHDADFATNVLLADLPTLVYFPYDDEFCRNHFSVEEYARLGEKYQRVLRFAVMGREHEQMWQRFGMGVFPAFLIFFCGRLIAYSCGWHGQPALQDMLNQVLTEHQLQ
jgi:hypothetical protein